MTNGGISPTGAIRYIVEKEDYMNWYFVVLGKYAVFSGRARRKEYWMFFLFNFLIGLALGVVLGLIGSPLAFAVSQIYPLAIIIPSLAVGIRRMHDIGRSGWWILCPFVNLVMLCLKGQEGENEYGADPKLV